MVVPVECLEGDLLAGCALALVGDEVVAVVSGLAEVGFEFGRRALRALFDAGHGHLVSEEGRVALRDAETLRPVGEELCRAARVAGVGELVAEEAFRTHAHAGVRGGVREELHGEALAVLPADAAAVVGLLREVLVGTSSHAHRRASVREEACRADLHAAVRDVVAVEVHGTDALAGEVSLVRVEAVLALLHARVARQVFVERARALASADPLVHHCVGFGGAGSDATEVKHIGELAVGALFNAFVCDFISVSLQVVSLGASVDANSIDFVSELVVGTFLDADHAFFDFFSEPAAGAFFGTDMVGFISIVWFWTNSDALSGNDISEDRALNRAHLEVVVSEVSWRTVLDADELVLVGVPLVGALVSAQSGFGVGVQVDEQILVAGLSADVFVSEPAGGAPQYALEGHEISEVLAWASGNAHICGLVGEGVQRAAGVARLGGWVAEVAFWTDFQAAAVGHVAEVASRALVHA